MYKGHNRWVCVLTNHTRLTVLLFLYDITSTSVNSTSSQRISNTRLHKKTTIDTCRHFFRRWFYSNKAVKSHPQSLKLPLQKQVEISWK